MTIQLGRLEWVAQLIGIRFPDADEDALWRCARAWHRAAEQLRLVPPEAARIGTQVAEAVAGETAARFEEVWRPIGTADGPLARLADACDAIAAGCDRAATEVEHAKILIWTELAALAATVAVFAALPGVGLLGGAVIAQAIASARVTILIVLERLARVVGGPIVATLDLRGVVARVRALLGLLAGSTALGRLPGDGDPSTGGAPSGGAGRPYFTQPNGLFDSALPPDLPGAFDTARTLLLASLPSLHPSGPQGTVPTPETAGGPVLSAGAPAPYPAGPAPVPPPPVPPPPVSVPPPPVPAPAGPFPPLAPPPGPVPPAPGMPPAPAAPGMPPAPGTPPTPGTPPPTPGTPNAPTPGLPPAPRPGPLSPSVATPPPMVTPPTGPPPPTPVVSATPGPPAVPGTTPPVVAPVAVVLGLPGAAQPATMGRSRSAGSGIAEAPATVLLSDAEALARARANLFATDAGYGFHPPGDEHRDLARAVRPTPGQVTLDLLADAEGFTIDNGRLTPAQFAGVLRELIGAGELTVRPGECLRLLSGCAGEAAATLADQLGIEVLTPASPLWTYLDGEEIVASGHLVEGILIPADPPDVRWCRYEPRTARYTNVS